VVLDLDPDPAISIAPLQALMPPWGHTLWERQVGELVLDVRTLSKLR